MAVLPGVLDEPESAVDEALMLARPLAARSGHDDFAQWCDDFLGSRDLTEESAAAAIKSVRPANFRTLGTAHDLLRRLDGKIPPGDETRWALFAAGSAALQLIRARRQPAERASALRQEAHQLARRACELLRVANSYPHSAVL